MEQLMKQKIKNFMEFLYDVSPVKIQIGPKGDRLWQVESTEKETITFLLSALYTTSAFHPGARNVSLIVGPASITFTWIVQKVTLAEYTKSLSGGRYLLAKGMLRGSGSYNIEKQKRTCEEWADAITEFGKQEVK